MFTLKLRKIGASVGFILPKEMLAHLNVKEGEKIFAVQRPAGYVITALDPNVRGQVEMGSAFMDGYFDTFLGLAK
jgi:putative addiction module antidote